MPRRSTSPLFFAVRAWVLGLVLLIPCAGRAGSGGMDYFVQTWQTDDGLPGNDISEVVQDRQGFIWLATIGGLMRFDGITFRQFSSPLITRAAARNIRALSLAPDGSLLMLPAVGGVVQFKNGQFSPHPISKDLAGVQLQTLFVDPRGAVWVGAGGGQAWRWEDGKTTYFSATNGFNSRVRITFAADREGNVWIASGGFLGRFRDGKLAHYFENVNGGEYTVVATRRAGGIWICQNNRLMQMADGKISTVSTNLPWVARSGVVRNLFEDRDRVLWVGTTAQGVYCGTPGQFSSVETSQSQIMAITGDDEGDIWIGTEGGGINRLRPKIFRLYNTKLGLPEEVSDSVCADDQGGVWLGNRSGGVAGIRDGKVIMLPARLGAHRLRAYSICADDQGAIWVSEGGLYRVPRGQPEEAQAITNEIAGGFAGVHVIYKNRRGDVWIGAEPNLLGFFREGRPGDYVSEDTFPGQHPRSLAEDPQGRMWIGTEDGQLFQNAGGKFTRHTQADGLPEAPIRALLAEADGSLWIGTMGSGLVLRRNGKFTLITEANGLPDGDITELLADDAGRLWCGTVSGIYYLAKSDLLAFADGKIPKVRGTAFNGSQGLTGISCLGASQPMACKTGDGQLWFATQQGVLALDSRKLTANPRPPPVIIDEVFLNDEPRAATDGLLVPPLCSKIEFRFSVLSYPAPQLVRVRYKLDGVDSDWVERVNQRSALYSTLAPGKYLLHVKACNNDGVWNESGTSLAFVVRPAWWQSWWFLNSLGAVLVITLVGIVRLVATRKLKLSLARLEQKRAVESERARIARDIHDDLGAGLTQIMFEGALARRHPQKDVQNHLTQISDRAGELIQAMDEIVWAVNPQNDTLESLVNYFSKYIQDFLIGAGIRCRLDIPEVIPARQMSPEVRHNVFLATKEALNNIVKHAQAREVHLKLAFQPERMTILIVDDGVGFAPKTGQVSTIAGRTAPGQGLRNMAGRMETIGGRFVIRSQPGQGTTIEMDIRLGTIAHTNG